MMQQAMAPTYWPCVLGLSALALEGNMADCGALDSFAHPALLIVRFILPVALSNGTYMIVQCTAAPDSLSIRANGKQGRLES